MDTTTVAEVWKPVAGFEGLYEVSNAGRVRCCRVPKNTGHPRNRLLAANLCGWGYLSVRLSKNSKDHDKSIHLLVLAAFVGEKPKGVHQGNHKNGIKTDNRAENLEWVTRSENIRHAHATGLLVVPGSQDHYLAKFSNETAKAIVLERRAGASLLSLAAKYGVTPTTVGRIARGQSWKRATKALFDDHR